ncbi:MAG TPA: type II toxin-antitoxin system PemK/MazF family toxin [Rhodopila sp.]|nr:type II toxin-antitoxin system PemK/MazF family toxin [Rhodopila sp.]
MTAGALRRGDVVVIADRGGDYTGKPRPAVVVQADLFAALDSVTICPVTSAEVDAPATRLRIEPSEGLPLHMSCWIAVDKVTAVRRSRIGGVVGRLQAEDVRRLDGALAVFLGLAG